MPTPQAPTPQDRFLSLIKRDILKLDAAELDFGIYRILNYRRDQVLAYLDTTLPGHIAEWADALAQTGGRVLAESEAANCYYHLHTFFSRYWDEGDFIPRARRGGSAAYAVPYNGQDTHFHWATKGSHYVKSGV
jgi:adenine-specific DNA-methyltransferase